MKTNEFIKHVEELGFRVETTHSNIELWKNKNCTVVATVRHDEMFGIATGLNFYGGLPLETQQTIFNLLVEYASTPIEEHKEEKKYYIKHKHLGTYSNHLNYDTEDSNWSFSECSETFSFKTKFTLSELPLWAKEMLEQGHLVKEEVE